MSCEDCAHFDKELPTEILTFGECISPDSDHYGHLISEHHPECPSFVAYEEPPPMCKGCKLEYVEKEGDLCMVCEEEDRKKHPYKYR